MQFNPWVGKIPRGGNGNPLQYSCLENPMDRGAWWATVHSLAKSRTRLKQLSTHAHTQRWPMPVITLVILEIIIPTGVAQAAGKCSVAGSHVLTLVGKGQD